MPRGRGTTRPRGARAGPTHRTRWRGGAAPSRPGSGCPGAAARGSRSSSGSSNGSRGGAARRLQAASRRPNTTRRTRGDAPRTQRPRGLTSPLGPTRSRSPRTPRGLATRAKGSCTAPTLPLGRPASKRRRGGAPAARRPRSRPPRRRERGRPRRSQRERRRTSRWGRAAPEGGSPRRRGDSWAKQVRIATSGPHRPRSRLSPRSLSPPPPPSPPSPRV
mmetsp:Transcript_35579/g.80249  ORF Transcript_35579/g.80249 Transcript_35579/m.80249 type:complete len:219 (+) Transcript_35579:1287-1943(+)